MAKHRALKSDALQEGQPAQVTLEGQPIMLVRFEGKVYATHNICSHSYALLSDGWFEDGCIECPLHQALFDVRTGRATCGPATEPVATYPVEEENGEILVNLEVCTTNNE